MLPSFLVARRAKFFSVSFQFLPSDFFRSCSDVVVGGGGDQRTLRASERGRGGQREREHEHVGVVEGANEQQCRRGRPSFPLSFAVGRLRAAVDVEPALLLPPSSPSSSSSLVRLSVDNCSPLSDTIFVERARRAGGRAGLRRPASALKHEVAWLQSRHNSSSSSSSKTWSPCCATGRSGPRRGGVPLSGRRCRTQAAAIQKVVPCESQIMDPQDSSSLY